MFHEIAAVREGHTEITHQVSRVLACLLHYFFWDFKEAPITKPFIFSKDASGKSIAYKLEWPVPKLWQTNVERTLPLGNWFFRSLSKQRLLYAKSVASLLIFLSGSSYIETSQCTDFPLQVGSLLYILRNITSSTKVLCVLCLYCYTNGWSSFVNHAW